MQILVIDPHDNGVEHEVAASAGSELDVDSEPVRHPMLNLKPNPTRASMVSIWIHTTESTVDRLAVLAQTESIFDVVLGDVVEELEAGATAKYPTNGVCVLWEVVDERCQQLISHSRRLSTKVDKRLANSLCQL